MEASRAFVKCETLFYGLSIHEPDVMITDIRDTKDLLYLNNLGYSIVIMNGKATLIGDQSSLARLIKDEIENGLQYRALGVREFIKYHYHAEDIFLKDVKTLIDTVRQNKPFGASFADIFEFVAENWILNISQLAELKKEEREHPEEIKSLIASN